MIILYYQGVLTCSHLFWSAHTAASKDKPIRDKKKVLDCLKKALKIANQCMDTTVQVNLDTFFLIAEGIWSYRILHLSLQLRVYGVIESYIYLSSREYTELYIPTFISIGESIRGYRILHLSLQQRVYGVIDSYIYLDSREYTEL